MLSRLHDIFTRNRKKFIIAGIIFGGSYITLKYFQKKINAMQARQVKDFIENTRRFTHFQTMESTCNQLILALGAELLQAILKECNTDDLLKQLRENPTNKLELWEEMKITSFTRLTAFIYSSSMLVVSLRIQLSILSGYLYGDNVIEDLQSSQENYIPKRQKVSDEMREKYLLLNKYFLNEGGLSELVQLIRSKVKGVLDTVPLTKPMTLADIEQLFWSIQMAINSDPNVDPCSKLCKYMLPADLSNVRYCGPLLEKMFNETLDLLESDDASSVCSNNICRGFTLAVDSIAENLTDTILSPKQSTEEETKDNTKTTSNANEHLLDINSAQIPLAKIIPIVTSLTAKGFNSVKLPQNLATSLLTFYVVSEKCKLLSANIYETFCSISN